MAYYLLYPRGQVFRVERGVRGPRLVPAEGGTVWEVLPSGVRVPVGKIHKGRLVSFREYLKSLSERMRTAVTPEERRRLSEEFGRTLAEMQLLARTLYPYLRTGVYRVIWGSLRAIRSAVSLARRLMFRGMPQAYAYYPTAYYPPAYYYRPYPRYYYPGGGGRAWTSPYSYYY